LKSRILIVNNDQGVIDPPENPTDPQLFIGSW